MLEDRRLLRRLRRGDAAALQRLCEKYKHDLLGLARGRSGFPAALRWCAQPLLSVDCVLRVSSIFAWRSLAASAAASLLKPRHLCMPELKDWSNSWVLREEPSWANWSGCAGGDSVTGARQ